MSSEPPTLETSESSHVVSRQRVVDHGEVLTGKREVHAMLDLVEHETFRIDSRFLEPACGTGNFLTEVLARKLRVVNKRYGRTQLDYERYAVLATCSVYGIDILEDNVTKCRERLLSVFTESYGALFPGATKPECVASVEFVLAQNIIWGDALTLRTVSEPAGHITFTEWSPVNGCMLKRRDFCFRDLLAHEAYAEMPLFSDLGEEAFVPVPDREHSPVHFLELAYAG